MEQRLSIDYLRVSKEDGDVTAGISEESQSIASQRAYIRQFRAAHPELAGSAEEIVDDGYSGTHFERPGIKRLLKMVEMGRVGTIIVKDLSRFARNYLEAGHYLEYVFPAHDIRFISINDNYDSAEYGESPGSLHVVIRNLINQMYSKDLSRKIKSAVDLKKMNGEYVYGTAPFGYKKGEVKNTIVVDEPAALTVKRIFTLACAGSTITDICKKLNADGITTPSVYLAKVRGKYKTRSFWTYESVRNILANRIYTGDTVPFKSHVVRVGSDKVKALPEEEQIVIPETHEAIITREMFYQAKKIVKSNSKTASKKRSSILSTYLVCGCCGNKLSKGRPQNKSFLCASARYQNDTGCKNIRCNEDKIKSVLVKAIQQQCMMMDANIKQIRALTKTQKSETDAARTELRFQRRTLESVQTAKMQLYESYVSQQVSKDDYLVKKASLNETEETAKMQISLLTERLEQLEAERVDPLTMAATQDLYARYVNLTELDESLMNELVKKIVVFPDGAINIVWNFKDIMQETKETSVL